MRRKIILTFIAILLGWFSGFLYFIYYTKSYSINNSTVTDAIVVLTGGRLRIETGIGLLKAGYAPILFISGIKSPNQLKNFLKENGIKQDQVIYVLNADTTEDNAREVAEFVANNEIDSIRLVTSSYHMPRALEEIRKLLSYIHNVLIIPHPVSSNNQSYSLLFKEYNKYLIIKLLDYLK